MTAECGGLRDVTRLRQHRRAARMIFACVVTALAMATAHTCAANDTAADIGVGGIRFKEETRVSLDRECLTISEDRVEVAYWFRNPTDSAVTTTVAFPIPEYEYEFDAIPPDFADFTVEADGAPVQYEKDIRASANGKDCTDLLTSRGISISDFDGIGMGREDDDHILKRLTPEDTNLFFERRVLESMPPWTGRPIWTVSIMYHWTQTFPPNGVTIIRHTYTPVIGYSPFANTRKDRRRFFREACPNKDTRDWIQRSIPKERYFSALWVNYILTTANNWAGPIAEFNLTVSNPERKHVLVCFDGESTSDSSPVLDFRRQDFAPRKDLKVFYLQKMPD